MIALGATQGKETIATKKHALKGQTMTALGANPGEKDNPKQ
jgi:hypothetical protein